MQPTFTEVKKAALSSLKCRWPEAIIASAAFLSVSLLNTLIQIILMSMLKVDAVWSPFSPTSIPVHNIIASVGITVFSAVFSLAVSFPLFFGVMRWFWEVTGGKNPSLKEIFVFFSTGRLFRKSVFLSFGLFVRLVIAAIVCLLPCVACQILINPLFYNHFGYAMPVWLESLHPLVGILRMMGIVAFVFWIVRYALFYTALFLHPDISAHRTIVMSKKLCEDNTVRFIGFALSFFGWGILCILVLPIMFVFPYVLASLSVYGREEYRFKYRT